MDRPLSLAPLNAGFTNQKLALVGLALEGIRQSRPIILPSLVDFFAGRPQHSPVGFASVFDELVFRERAASVGVRILPDIPEAERLDGWDCFRSMAAEFSKLGRAKALHPQALPCTLLAALVPSKKVAAVASQAATTLKSHGVEVMCQLRIENDWQTYAQKTLLERVKGIEDCPLTAVAILKKLAGAVDVREGPIYVTCNEEDLPLSTSEIASEVRKQLGYVLLWKKDVLDVATISSWSYLEKAALDFELALSAPSFVGTTRSTFFNIAALTCFSRGNAKNPRFFAYNVLGARAVERTDHGAFAGVAEATKPNETDGKGVLSLTSDKHEVSSALRGQVPEYLRSFYERYAGTPTSGWSAEFVAASEPHYLRAQEAIAEVFGTSALPLKSARTYLEHLKRHHEANKGGVYCEIGINLGDSLVLGRDARLCIGVDPMPRVAAGSFEEPPFVVVRDTSDQFFAKHASNILQGSKIGLTFIDGLHIFEFALRDFIGAEQFASPDGKILIHDVLPRTELEASRTRITRSWTGDVWRLVYVLRRFRPGLSVEVVDAQPTGLAIISGLDPENRELVTRYEEVVKYGLSLSSSEMMRARDQLLGVRS